MHDSPCDLPLQDADIVGHYRGPATSSTRAGDSTAEIGLNTAMSSRLNRSCEGLNVTTMVTPFFDGSFCT